MSPRRPGGASLCFCPPTLTLDTLSFLGLRDRGGVLPRVLPTVPPVIMDGSPCGGARARPPPALRVHLLSRTGDVRRETSHKHCVSLSLSTRARRPAPVAGGVVLALVQLGVGLRLSDVSGVRGGRIRDVVSKALPMAARVEIAGLSNSRAVAQLPACRRLSCHSFGMIGFCGILNPRPCTTLSFCEPNA